MYVSVVNEAGDAGPRPRPGRLRRPRGQRRARSAARRAGRRADADRHARRHQPGRARATSRDMRDGAAAVHRRADRRRAARTRSRSSPSASGRPIFADYSTDRGGAEEGRRSHLGARPTAARTCSTAIIETSQGFKKREAPRPVIVAITTEGPELSNRQYQQVLEPLRASRRRLHVDHARPAVVEPQRRGPQSQRRARPGTADDRRQPRRAADEHGARGPAAAAGRRADAPVPVTYARPQSLIPPERVTVAAAKPGLTARGTLIKEHAGTPVTASSFLAPSVAVVAAAVAALDATPSRRRSSRSSSPPPAGRRRPFRAGVDLVSLNVTVTDGTDALRHRPRARGLQRLRGRRQAGRHLLQPHQPADRARAAARHQRQHGSEAADGAGSGDRLRQAAAAAGSRRDHRLRQPRRRPRSRSPTSAAELEQAIRKTSAGGSTSLYNAVYIALKDLKKIVAKNAEEIRRQAIVVLSDGEDTSSLLPFEEVLDLAKRSETAIYAIGLRSAEGPARRARASRKRSSSCASSRRKPAAARSSRTRSPSSPASTARSPTSCRASTRSATRRATRRRDGAWRRVVVRVDRPNTTARTKQGYFAPTHAELTAAHELRSPGRSTRSRWSPTRGTSRGAMPVVGRAATTLLVAAALAHTFVIGMQTMEVGHVPMAGATVGDLDVRAGCWRSPTSTSR